MLYVLRLLMQCAKAASLFFPSHPSLLLSVSSSLSFSSSLSPSLCLSLFLSLSPSLSFCLSLFQIQIQKCFIGMTNRHLYCQSSHYIQDKKSEHTQIQNIYTLTQEITGTRNQNTNIWKTYIHKTLSLSHSLSHMHTHIYQIYVPPLSCIFAACPSLAS